MNPIPLNPNEPYGSSFIFEDWHYYYIKQRSVFLKYRYKNNKMDLELTKNSENSLRQNIFEKRYLFTTDLINNGYLIFDNTEQNAKRKI